MKAEFWTTIFTKKLWKVGEVVEALLNNVSVYCLLHMHTFGMSAVEILTNLFWHGVSDPIKNCAGVLLP